MKSLTEIANRLDEIAQIFRTSSEAIETLKEKYEPEIMRLLDRSADRRVSLLEEWLGDGKPTYKVFSVKIGVSSARIGQLLNQAIEIIFESKSHALYEQTLAEHSTDIERLKKEYPNEEIDCAMELWVFKHRICQRKAAHKARKS